MLSQFEDLQQCYLRLRKSGKTPAAAATLPVSPFQQGTAELEGIEPPSKRIKQEHQPQSTQTPAGSTAAAETPQDGQGAKAGVSPAEPVAAVAAASQVGRHLHAGVAAQVCAVPTFMHHGASVCAQSDLSCIFTQLLFRDIRNFCLSSS